jgi:hypothetical protein
MDIMTYMGWRRKGKAGRAGGEVAVVVSGRVIDLCEADPNPAGLLSPKRPEEAIAQTQVSLMSFI